jgi:tetratricopeptide (TPR) repeat protein
MNGHANDQQRRRIQQLEERLHRDIASEDDILELALLAIEPGHDGVRAAGLLSRLPASDPLRNVWLAFVDIYELMDLAALAEAVDACSEALGGSTDVTIQAAALMLRAAAQRHLTHIAQARADCEESVRLAPHWIGNRQLLSQILTELGEYAAARKQLIEALHNVRPIPHPEEYVDYMFEQLITARSSDGIEKRLRSKLGTGE